MANIIKPKRTSTAGKVPTTADLASGEIGVNMADKKVYINYSGTIVEIGSGLLSGLGDVALSTLTAGQTLSWNGTAWTNSSVGTGDVVGPSSATDNAIARFDATTGKLIQNSVITIDDSGNEAGLLSEQYDITDTPPAIVAGLEAWDSGNGTLEVGLAGGNVSYKYGQQEFVRAYNGSGASMTKGQVVYIVGAQGNRVDVRLAKADAESTSAHTIGFVVETIANGAEGWVQVSGSLYKLDTSTLTAGQTIYLSPTTAGAYTSTRPTAPNHTVILGFVQRVSATVGSLYVKVDNGYELDELHNVLITTPTSGNTLIYDASALVWKNANITAGSGISVTNGAGSITIAATNAGTVTGVTATSPVASSGGTAPVISLSAGYGDTLNPYASKTANFVLAAPTGVAGVPTFRAIVAADIPTLNQNTTGTAANVTGTVAIANGGTGSTTANGALTNLFSYTTTATAAGTTTLTNTSTYRQYFTGVTTQTVVMPVVTGLALGWSYEIVNNSTGALTVQSSGLNTITTVPAGISIIVTCTAITGTTAASWHFEYASFDAITGSGACVFATSPTLVTPALGTPSSGTLTNCTGYTYANLSGTVPTWNQNTTGSSASCTGNAATATTATTATTANGVAAGVVAGKMIYDTFTATASQTSFTTSATYTSGKIEVYANGVKMVNGSDVTVTSGTSVVFATGVAVNTRVDLVYPI